MNDDSRIKSSSIRSKFEFLHDRFGEAAERAMKDRFRDRGNLPVLDSVMYPFEDRDAVSRVDAGGFCPGAVDLTGIEELDRGLTWNAFGAWFQLRRR